MEYNVSIAILLSHVDPTQVFPYNLHSAVQDVLCGSWMNLPDPGVYGDLHVAPRCASWLEGAWQLFSLGLADVGQIFHEGMSTFTN